MINRKITTYLTILLIGLLIFFIDSCQHIIQLQKDLPLSVSEELAKFQEVQEASKDPNTLTILVPSGIVAETVKEISAEFEKAYGIKTMIMESDIWTIKDLVNLDVYNASSEKIVDIIFYPDYFISENPQHFHKLNEKIKEDNVDLSDFFIDIFNSVSKWGDGQILGIPVMYSFFAIAIRSDILFELGIPLEEKWDYEQYYTVMENINKNVSIENTVLFDPSKLNISWINRYWSLGGLTIGKNWEFTINNEKAYKAIEMLQLMKNYYLGDLFAKKYDDIILDFINGKSAIFEGYMDFLFTKSEELSSSEIFGKIGISSISEDPEKNFNILSTDLVGISEFSNKKDKAWEWVKFYTNKENSKTFLGKFGLLPVRISTYEDKKLNDKYQELNSIYKILKNTKFRTLPKINASYDIWEDSLNKRLKEALVENKPPEDITLELQKDWEKIMNMKPAGIKEVEF